jgi:hypothetical protein
MSESVEKGKALISGDTPSKSFAKGNLPRLRSLCKLVRFEDSKTEKGTAAEFRNLLKYNVVLLIDYVHIDLCSIVVAFCFSVQEVLSVETVLWSNGTTLEVFEAREEDLKMKEFLA